MSNHSATLVDTSMNPDAYCVAYRRSWKGPSTFDFNMLLNSVKQSNSDARHALRPQFKPKSNKPHESERTEAALCRKYDGPLTKRYTPRTAMSRCASVVIYSNEGVVLQHLIKTPVPATDTPPRVGLPNAYISRCKKIQTLQKQKEFYHSISHAETRALLGGRAGSGLGSDWPEKLDAANRCRTASPDFRLRQPHIDRLIGHNAMFGELNAASERDEDYMNINPTQVLEAK